MKINYRNLSIFLVISAAWLFFGPELLKEYSGIEPTLRNYIPYVGISALLVVLFTLKKFGGNPHMVDSMGLLSLGITVTTASFDLFPNDDYGRVLKPVSLVIITVIWFVYFGLIIKPKELTDYDKNEKEKLFVKQGKYFSLVIFVSLLVLEIAFLIVVLSSNQFLN